MIQVRFSALSSVCRSSCLPAVTVWYPFCSRLVPCLRSDSVLTHSPHWPKPATAAAQGMSNLFLCAAASVQRQCSTLSNDRKFLLDMLYSKTAAAVPLSPTAGAPNTAEEEGERAHVFAEPMKPGHETLSRSDHLTAASVNKRFVKMFFSFNVEKHNLLCMSLLIHRQHVKG